MMFNFYFQVFLVAVALFLANFFIWKCRQQLWAEWQKLPRVYVLGLVCLVLIDPFLTTYYQLLKNPSSNFLITYNPFSFLFVKHGLFPPFLRVYDFLHIQKEQGGRFLFFLNYFILKHTGISVSTIVLGAGGIIGIFFLSLWVGLSFPASFICTVLYTFTPERFLVDGSIDPVRSGYLFFVIWSAAFSFLLLRFPGKNLFYLTVFFWTYAVLVRGETIFLFSFFILAVRFLLPKDANKDMPWANGLFSAAAILGPFMIIGIPYVFGGHRLVMQHEVGVSNFIYNVGHFGWPFLAGRMHPVVLTFLAILGAGCMYGQNKKTALLLAGWLLLLSLTYFSMWLQIYGESKLFLPKVLILVSFYPPFLIFASTGIVWLAESYFSKVKYFAITVISGIILVLYLPYWPEILTSFIFYPKTVRSVLRQFDNSKDYVVGCYSDTEALDPIKADWFMNNTRQRHELFQTIRVWLVEDSTTMNQAASSSACREAVPLIKDKGKAILFKKIKIGDVFYNIYSLSEF